MTPKIHTIDDHAEMEHLRVNYFAGQFLEEKDFQTEQQYHLMRRRQLNRELFSPGVRQGFALAVNEDDGKTLSVQPGAAIDAQGHELWLEDVKVLSLPALSDGNYVLCMQVVEIPRARESYSVPTQGADGSKAGDSKTTWEGDTRSADTIQFSLVEVSQALTPDELKKNILDTHIKLAHMLCKEGRFSIVDTKIRDMSTTRAGNGISIDLTGPGHYIDMQYNGAPNAYIGPNLARQTPDCVNFSSLSKRMHLSGDEELYVLNKKGIVVGKEWDSSGELLVQGATTLRSGVEVTGDAQLNGTLKIGDRLTIADTTITSVKGDSDVTIAAGQGRVSLNAKGKSVIVGQESGSLHVQGTTFAQGGLRVIQGNKDQGTRQVLAITGTTITSIESNFGVTIDSAGGKLSLGGASTLYITNKSGVVIAKDGDASGTLHVKGKAHLEGGLDVTHAVDIKGSLEVRDEIRFAGAELKTRDGNSGVIFDSHANDLYLHGQKTLYISNKNGVVIAKDGADGAGTLTVKGKAHLQGGLDVMQDVDINGSLTVRNGALKADKELIVPGATFTSHAGTMKLESTMKDKENRHPMHISGDTLFLLQKEKVVIGKYWQGNGDLEVQGNLALGGAFSAGVHANHGDALKKMEDRLRNPGDFIFFVEPHVGSSNGRLIAVWRTPTGLNRTAI